MKIYDVTMLLGETEYEVHAFIAAETDEIGMETAKARYGDLSGFYILSAAEIGQSK